MFLEHSCHYSLYKSEHIINVLVESVKSDTNGVTLNSYVFQWFMYITPVWSASTGNVIEGMKEVVRYVPGLLKQM